MTGRKDPRIDILGKSSGKLTCQESIPTCRRNRKVAPAQQPGHAPGFRLGCEHSSTSTPRAGATSFGLSPQLHFPEGTRRAAPPLAQTREVPEPEPACPGRAGMPDGGRRGPVPGRPVTEEAGAKSSCPRLLGGGRPGLGRRLHANGPRPGHSDHASAGRRGPSLTGGRQ